MPGPKNSELDLFLPKSSRSWKTEIFGFLALIAPFRVPLCLSGLLTVLGSVSSLAMPWLGGRFVGRFLDSAATRMAFPERLILGFLALWAVRSLTAYGSSYLLSRSVEQLVARLRIEIHNTVQLLPISFHDAKRQGDLASLLSWDLYTLGQFFAGVAVNVPSQLFTFIGAAILMLQINLRLGLVAVVGFPIFLVLARRFSGQLNRRSRQLAEAHGESAAIAYENLQLISLIKAFRRTDYAAERYGRQIRKIERLMTETLHAEAVRRPVIELSGVLLVAGLVWFGGSLWTRGSMTAVQLTTFLLYGMMTFRPIMDLTGVLWRWQETSGAIGRVREVFVCEPDEETSGPAPVPALRGAIEFRGVFFAYPGRPETFTDLNLLIPAGHKIAITGPNGSGKTTLGLLLLGFYPPGKGTILIDDTEMSALLLCDIRSAIGWVPQNVVLFNATIAENIGFGKDTATEDQIIQAARQANAHEMIARLPDGYQTRLGDRGARISEGQKQRIALARCLLRDPRILILDEPTAMFDPQAEADFIEESEALFAGRTVILITHSRRCLGIADRVLRLEAGQLTEDGLPVR